MKIPPVPQLKGSFCRPKIVLTDLNQEHLKRNQRKNIPLYSSLYSYLLLPLLLFTVLCITTCFLAFMFTRMPIYKSMILTLLSVTVSYVYHCHFPASSLQSYEKPESVFATSLENTYIIISCLFQRVFNNIQIINVLVS